MKLRDFLFYYYYLFMMIDPIRPRGHGRLWTYCSPTAGTNPLNCNGRRRPRRSAKTEGGVQGEAHEVVIVISVLQHWQQEVIQSLGNGRYNPTAHSPRPSRNCKRGCVQTIMQKAIAEAA
jgi:hypothetical protein